MAPRPPGLYRLARALRRGAILAVVLVIAYVALAGYSVSKFRPSDVHVANFSSPQLVGPAARLGGELNLTNPGLLPVDSLSIAATVRFANGSLLGTVAPGSVAIPAGASATLPIEVDIPLAGATGAASLLTVDQELSIRFDVNVTYASVFDASAQASANHSWGAPFSGLNVTPGAPVPGPGGTVHVPLTISFDDHAPWADSGNLTIALTHTGTGCARGTTVIALNVPPQGTYSRTTQFNTTQGCLTPGQSVSITYSGNGSSLSLPPQRIS